MEELRKEYVEIRIRRMMHAMLPSHLLSKGIRCGS